MITPPKAWLSWSLLALVGLAGACSTPGPARDPVEDALSESQEAVFTGIEDGFDESESVDQYAVTARYNPCRCEAPSHEIYVHGRWTRVFLEADKALLSEIEAKFAGEQGALTTIELRGSLSGDETTPRGVEFPVFEATRMVSEEESDRSK